MLKMIGSLLTMGAAAMIGMAMAEEEEKFFQEMVSLEDVIFRFRGELWYARAQMPRIFRELSGQVKNPYSEWFLQMAEQMEQKNGGEFGRIWRQTTELYLSKVLPKEEGIRLKKLGDYLGHADAEMQITYLDRYLEVLRRRKEERRQILQEQKKIYRCLGITGGILVAVMLV